MSKENLSAFFQKTSLVSSTIANELADHFEHRTIKKNDFFLKEKKIADQYFYLDTGYMRSFAFDVEGNEITTGFYPPGQVVFEVSSFFNRTVSKENIQALTDCEGWFITYKQLNDLFHSIPEFREFGRAMLVKGFAELKNRMLATITETAEERYSTLLKNKPEIFQHVALKNIATYLGVTDTSLSRIRAALSKK
jgi:CRP-like cAMP-binding protein